MRCFEKTRAYRKTEKNDVTLKSRPSAAAAGRDNKGGQ